MANDRIPAIKVSIVFPYNRSQPFTYAQLTTKKIVASKTKNRSNISNLLQTFTNATL